MFTGIIETLGEVISVTSEQTNVVFKLTCPFTHELKVDQSLAHNGVCLTVTAIEEDGYSVTAISETLLKTNLGRLEKGSIVNLERCMQLNGRVDGHLVQGHVDCTAIVTEVEEKGGSWEIGFNYQPEDLRVTVEKGSITINGVSLTVVKSENDFFSVAIIPYTWQHTTFHRLVPGDEVNIEFDIIGKYVAKLFANSQIGSKG